MRKLTLIAAVFFCSLFSMNAGEGNYTIGEEVSFKSEILNEERSIIVYTPMTYTMTDMNYPVLYLLDGGSHFHHASGIVQFLSAQGLMPEMIVVAVKNVDRTRDFSPTHTEKRPTTGGAEKFMGFLESELLPFVNRNYRTEPYEILMGHSFGGTFATYALLNKPDVFNAYIAISPYMMYDDAFVVKEAKTKLQSKYNNVQFYMTVGNEPDYFETLAEFEEIVETKSPKGFKYTYVKMEDEDHGSIPHLTIYQALESIYADWKLPKETFQEGLAAVDGHFKKLSDEYGFEINTPEYTVNALGYYYMNKKDMQKSIQVFEENVKRFPKSANVYDSLGEAFENDNQIAEAAENYKMAVKYASKVDHPNLKIYTENLNRVQKEMAHN